MNARAPDPGRPHRYPMGQTPRMPTSEDPTGEPAEPPGTPEPGGPYEPPGPPVREAAEWSPRPVVVALGWVLALAALAWTVFGGQAAGRLLTGVATIALIVLALHGSVARPRLRADAGGLAVRRLSGTLRWPWSTVLIRVTRTRRLGREVALLELDGPAEDGAEQLVVLGRLDLGVEPDEVADVLRGLRPRPQAGA